MIDTVHGADVKELYQKPELGAAAKTRGIWQIDYIIRQKWCGNSTGMSGIIKEE